MVRWACCEEKEIVVLLLTVQRAGVGEIRYGREYELGFGAAAEPAALTSGKSAHD